MTGSTCNWQYHEAGKYVECSKQNKTKLRSRGQIELLYKLKWNIVREVVCTQTTLPIFGKAAEGFDQPALS